MNLRGFPIIIKPMKIVTNFFKGIGYIFQGAGYFLKNKDLWKYVLFPMIINTILLIISLTLVFIYLGDVTEYIRTKLGFQYKEYDVTTLAAKIWITNTFVGLIGIIIGTILFIFFGLLFFMLTQIIASPFYDALSERVEEKFTAQKVVEMTVWQSLKNIPRVVLTELKKTTILLMIPIVLLILMVVPVIGNISYIICTAVFTSTSYGASFVDYIQARKNQTFDSRSGFVKNNFSLLLGFGLPVFIPFLNLFINPFMVTGGTILYLEKTSKNPQN